MAEAFSVHAELTKLWKRAMSDKAAKEGDYEPALVRLDELAHTMLMREARHISDGSLDFWKSPPTWRGMPVIVESSTRVSGAIDEPTWRAVSLMTVEFKQRGKYGRSLYFDWSAEQYAKDTAPSSPAASHG